MYRIILFLLITTVHTSWSMHESRGQARVVAQTPSADDGDSDSELSMDDDADAKEALEYWTLMVKQAEHETESTKARCLEFARKPSIDELAARIKEKAAKIQQKLPPIQKRILSQKPREGLNERNRNFLNAVLAGKVAEARSWLRQGADIEMVGEWGNRPLHIAACHGGEIGLRMIRMLLAEGAIKDVSNYFSAKPSSYIPHTERTERYYHEFRNLLMGDPKGSLPELIDIVDDPEKRGRERHVSFYWIDEECNKADEYYDQHLDCLLSCCERESI